MIEGEDFPLSFRKTILNMIWKQKGPAEILKNSRFSHEGGRVPAQNM